MKLSNEVEKYEIEVTKMGQNYSFLLKVKLYENNTNNLVTGELFGMYVNLETYQQ